MRVLIVEDHAELAEAIANGLRCEGMAVDVANDGAQGLYSAQVYEYDVVVLDRDLPKLHGDEVTARMVDAGARPRILMLTASGEVQDRVDGLSMGADDYLTKPFAFVELVARVRALARRAQPALAPVLESGGARLERGSRLVTRDGQRVDLSAKEFTVLELLMSTAGTALPAEEILARLGRDRRSLQQRGQGDHQSAAAQARRPAPDQHGTRALRPRRTMTSSARQITEENLRERLSVDTQEDEIGELATTFDGVLARLQHAFDAQKRFVANASHELRTPVTLERALLEIALADPDADAETLRHTCERVLASTQQQQQMIEALPTLTRSQRGTDVEAPVNLADLAQDAITLREHRLVGVTLATDLHAATLSGDPALLERLVANLIDNAIIHNLAEDPWITVETGNQGAGSWLRVSNRGPQISEWMISELFEPFRRMDGERTATTTGLGLGLSIVRAIADVHGATVATRPVESGGLQVEVRF